MARWTDLATWRGNGENQGPGGMVEHRGLVLHIAVGWYEGTIAWQRNPKSRVSSHFVVGRSTGELAQMVDTAVRAWTQGDGSGRWLSSENEGFLASDRRNPGGWEKLSAWQIEANARLLAKAHKVYGVPLAVAVHPGQNGLGHHSMDREWLDEQWGHDECPGAAIVAQKPAIVARAKEIVGGDDMPLSSSDLEKIKDTLMPFLRFEVSDEVWAGQGTGRLAHGHYSVPVGARNGWAYGKVVLAELKAATGAQKKRDEAILAGISGLDTAAILARIDTRAAEDAARDAALTELVDGALSGERDAAEVLRLIAQILAKAAEGEPSEPTPA